MNYFQIKKIIYRRKNSLAVIIKLFNEFINESVFVHSDDWKESNGVIKFHLSSNFVEVLKKIDNPISKLYLNLIDGVDKNILVKDPFDYFDVNLENGDVSYLKSRYLTEVGKYELYTSSRRISTKFQRMIRDIYTNEYLDKVIKPSDIENFLNKLSITLFPKIQVLEFRGDEILRAYNYKRELDSRKFGFTCANFGQSEPGGSGYPEPTVGMFDIYTKNPENCGVIVTMEGDKITGRCTFQEGIQTDTYGTRLEGSHQIVRGFYYGELGRGGKYDILIKEKLDKMGATHIGKGDTFRVQLKDTRFKDYCPFDCMSVNFELNQLADRSLGRYWVDTYNAHCPQIIIDKKFKD